MTSSIIIVLYNGKKYLKACLDSILAQCNGNTEIVVIDNASTDGGAELVQNCYPAVRLVRNKKNVGFAAACNQGAQLGQGEILVFLNQDTRVCPGWLDGLVAPLVSNPGIGLVTSKLLLMSNPEVIDMCGQDIHYSGLPFGIGTLKPAEQCSTRKEVCAVSGASFCIRRDLWQHLGGFDPQFFMYFEETDLSFRARLVGFSSYYSPDSVALHDDRLSPSINAIFYTARNRWLFLMKTWKIRTLLLLTPGLLLSELIDWSVTILYGWKAVVAKMRGIGWLLIHFPAILKRRHLAQSTRTKPDWHLLAACSPILKPSIRHGGVIGKGIVLIMNFFLRLNYQTALSVEKFLDW